MAWVRRMLAGFNALLRKHRVEQELDDELRACLDMSIEAKLHAGMTRAHAIRAARVEMGSLEAVKDYTRDVGFESLVETTWQDVRYAVRKLRRTPGFAAVTILTLGLGTGANLAIFSLMDQVVLRALPVREPGELVLLDGPGPFQGRTSGDQVFSVPMFRGLQEASEPLLGGLFARFNTTATVTIANDAELASAELVSGDYFRTLGVEAALGRVLSPEDDRTRGAHPAIVLSYGYWQRRFGADTGVLNRGIRINGHPMTIVGVTSPGFTGVELGSSADFFVPLMMKAELTPTWNDLDSWRSRWVHAMGRLKTRVTREQVAAGLNVRYRQLLQEDIKTARLSSDLERAQFLEKTLLVHPGGRGRSRLRDEFSAPLVVLMGMVSVVLLIACANVASLLMARATTEQKEVAIRLALGAGRFRVMRQRLAESFVLATAGAIVGLFFAWWVTDLLIQTLPFGRTAVSAELDLRIVLFAIGIAGATALVFGVAPAVHATKRGRTLTLKEEIGSVAGGGSQARVRKALVVAQIALSILLLVGAALFARSLYNLRNLQLGFVADNLLQFRMQTALSGYTRERSMVLFRTLQDRLAALPGVTSVSAAVVPAITGAFGYQTVRVQGYDPAEGEDMSPAINRVGPGYFATLGIPLISGREFRGGDDSRSPKVAVINESMAKYFWGGEDPIGRRFGRDGSGTDDEFAIVGVVQDSKFISIRDESQRFFYVPYMQADTINSITFYVRHRPDLEGIASAARRLVQRLDPSLPVFDMKTMEAQVNESLFLDRLIASLSVLFGALATLLAVIGLYGVMSYTVSRRTREIGIRIALGADRASVLWMVLREVSVLAMAGILLGLPMAVALSRFVESQLFGLSPNDPVMLATAVMTLSIIAMTAGYLPARRAANLDPIRALRWE